MNAYIRFDQRCSVANCLFTSNFLKFLPLAPPIRIPTEDVSSGWACKEAQTLHWRGAIAVNFCDRANNDGQRKSHRDKTRVVLKGKRLHSSIWVVKTCRKFGLDVSDCQIMKRLAVVFCTSWTVFAFCCLLPIALLLPSFLLPEVL